MEKMKILFVTSEAHPFAKSGGLGDVAYSLPKALVKTTDIRVIMPKYTTIHDKYCGGMELVSTFTTKVSWREKYVGLYKMDYDKVPFYFIDNEDYFKRDNSYGYFDDGERFAYFSRAVIDSIEHMDFVPDVIHCNDWQSALVPVFLKAFYKEKYKDMKVVYTIHNLKFQGVYNKNILGDILGLDESYFDEEALKYNDDVSYMKGGIIFSDYITTVSETYANEIKYPFFGEGLHGLFQKLDHKVTGIVNGIDYDTFNPRKDKELSTKYGISTRDKKTKNKLALQKELGLVEDENTPMVGIVTRLTGQKGLDLIAHILEELLLLDIQLVVLGTGDIEFEDLFRYYANIYPSKLSANIMFDSKLAKKIYAGSDIFLMPSLFEPCGLSQLISMRYGTIPVVRETGGLKDTVIPYDKTNGKGTGFGFRNYNAHELLEIFKYSLEVYSDKEAWSGLVKNAMERKSSWATAAKEYKKIYANITKDIAKQEPKKEEKSKEKSKEKPKEKVITKKEVIKKEVKQEIKKEPKLEPKLESKEIKLKVLQEEKSEKLLETAKKLDKEIKADLKGKVEEEVKEEKTKVEAKETKRKTKKKRTKKKSKKSK